jgi:hypothetical protein
LIEATSDLSFRKSRHPWAGAGYKAFVPDGLDCRAVTKTGGAASPVKGRCIRETRVITLLNSADKEPL